MPTYLWRCSTGHEWESWQSIRDDSRPDCTCGADVLKVMVPPRLYGVGAPGAQTRRVDRTEKTWDQDRPAYKRLRMNGMQPPHVDGAHKLEALAKNDLEVNTGLRYGHFNESSIKGQITDAQETGWAPKMKETV